MDDGALHPEVVPKVVLWSPPLGGLLRAFWFCALAPR